jgi:transposase-like protein
MESGMEKQEKQQKPKKTCKKYPASVRENVLQRMRLGANISQLARELGVGRRTLYQWKEKSEQQAAQQPEGKTKPALAGQDARDYQIRELTLKVVGLEGELGRAELEKRFFASALRRIGATRQKPESSGAMASSPRSGSGRKRKAKD